MRYVAKDELPWYYQSKLAVEYSRRNQTGDKHQTNRDAEIINNHLDMKEKLTEKLKVIYRLEVAWPITADTSS